LTRSSVLLIGIIPEINQFLRSTVLIRIHAEVTQFLITVFPQDPNDVSSDRRATLVFIEQTIIQDGKTVNNKVARYKSDPPDNENPFKVTSIIRRTLNGAAMGPPRVIRPAGGQPPASLWATRGLSALRAYLAY
jgi:hypothetical protein